MTGLQHSRCWNGGDRHPVDILHLAPAGSSLSPLTHWCCRIEEPWRILEYYLKINVPIHESIHANPSAEKSPTSSSPPIYWANLALDFTHYLWPLLGVNTDQNQ